MEDARQIAVGAYRRVLENGPDRCDSESDLEHSDHGEEIPFSSAYTPDMLNEDGKPKKGGRQPLSKAQVLGLRAVAQRAPSQVESTIQAVSLPLTHADPTTRTPTSSRPPAPIGPDADAPVPPKDPEEEEGTSQEKYSMKGKMPRYSRGSRGNG
jgi:hypothetical protein